MEESLAAPGVEETLRRLGPHLVGRTRRGVVGSSRYALALREALRQAAQDPKAAPVLIVGEPGLEKDNLASLVHFGSAARKQLLVRLDGALLREDGVELFGPASSDGEGALLARLGSGALLIDKLDRVAPALQPALLELAATVGADLLVMGCYGHSRARELILGGASRTVLESTTVPVLMSH